MKIGNKEFSNDRTHIMGILNITPDSFYDGGKYNSRDSALRHISEMINAGVEIIDVGGESTRPGFKMISDEEEINRICPVIELIKREFDIPVSLDTYKSNVAREGIGSGADMINDIWGLKYDEAMSKLISESGVCCCLMHNRSNTEYNDFLNDMHKELQESIEIALNAKIEPHRIILDPGIGFGKTYEQNLICLKNLNYFNDLGFPLLLGTSRKSVIGKTLNLPKEELMEGTLVTSVLAALNKYMFIRVHDVKENYRAIKMLEGIYGRNNY